EHDAYGRFRFGIPPKNAGDYAFVQHMIASLKHDGVAGVVMPHGVLFRGGAEGKIRQGILESDLLEAVVGLPSGLFYGTGIPACILILNRDKSEERKGKVLFIAAESDFQEGKNQNFLRSQDIDKVVSVFAQYEDIEKYARLISLEEIKSNDFNLNITRYIDKSIEEEQMDLNSILIELSQLEEEQKLAKDKVQNYLKELGVGESS